MNWLSRTRRTYLDWAAAAPVSPEAKRAFESASSLFGNPSSAHTEGQRAKRLLESARSDIARICGAKPRMVSFTSGATEANAIAILGRARKLHAQGIPYADMHALYLPTAHASTRMNMERLAELGVHVEELPLTGSALDLKLIPSLLRAETILISCDAACSETGIRFDTRGLSQVVAAHPAAKRALLHVDASQLPLVEPLERTRFGADLLVLDAQKVGGVRGVGVLVADDPNSVSSIAGGGGQELGLRPGTEPVALAAAFAAALQAAALKRGVFSEHALTFRTELIRSLTATIPEVAVTSAKRQLPHILSVSLPGTDTEYLAALLDAKGFAVSTRSACETDLGTESRAVLAYTGDPSLARSTLRISWGPTTRKRDLMRIVPAITEALPLAPLR